MDVNNLRTGEKIAGAAGLALLLIMFIFDWFTVDAGFGFTFGGNAWDTMELIRFILFLAAIAGIALAVIAATRSDVNLPVALSAIVTGLAALSVLLILFRIVSPPDGGVDELDVGRSIGVWLGLIAAAALTYGGYRAMQDEGTTFGDQADRFQNDPPPPPPPPPATPAA